MSLVAFLLVPHPARTMQSVAPIKLRIGDLVADYEANDSRPALFRAFDPTDTVLYEYNSEAGMPQNPFEEFGKEFRRAMEEHAALMRKEMKRARKQMLAA